MKWLCWKQTVWHENVRCTRNESTTQSVQNFLNISRFARRAAEVFFFFILSIFSKQPVHIHVAPYSRPVPYSRHSPYSRHFFNDTHENDCVWALFPIAVSGDHSSTQVCKEILSILSIFFGEASQRYHAKLFSPDRRFVVPLNIIIFEIPR